jgi:hypothetical protein
MLSGEHVSSWHDPTALDRSVDFAAFLAVYFEFLNDEDIQDWEVFCQGYSDPELVLSVREALAGGMVSPSPQAGAIIAGGVRQILTLGALLSSCSPDLINQYALFYAPAFAAMFGFKQSRTGHSINVSAGENWARLIAASLQGYPVNGCSLIGSVRLLDDVWQRCVLNARRTASASVAETVSAESSTPQPDARHIPLGASKPETHYIPPDVSKNPQVAGLPHGLVRLLGFSTLPCGCVVGRYRELATSREVAYIEEKAAGCNAAGHRRNHTVAPEMSSHHDVWRTNDKLA